MEMVKNNNDSYHHYYFYRYYRYYYCRFDVFVIIVINNHVAADADKNIQNYEIRDISDDLTMMMVIIGKYVFV